MNLSVGQVVYSMPVGNAARGRTVSLSPVVVRKIGRKWVQCSSEANPAYLTSYDIQRGYDDPKGFSSHSRIVLDAQQWEDEKEAARLVGEIRRAFDWGPGDTLSLAQLRQIKVILDHP